MPDTNLNISMKEYMRLVAKDTKKAEGNPIYSRLLKDLSEFAPMMQGYLKTNEDGNAPVLGTNDYKKLIDGYSKLAEDCSRFLAEDREKTRLESKRIIIITRLSSYIAQDLRGLLEADKTKPATLSEVIKESRTKTVDLTGKELGGVGGALSNRIPLKSDSGVEGFFTKKSVLDYETSLNAVMERIPQVLPLTYRSEYKGIRAERFLKHLKYEYVEDIHSKNRKIQDASYKALARTLTMLRPEMSLHEATNVLLYNEKFADDLQKLQKDCRYATLQKDIHEAAGVQDKSRIDQRNSAMTDIAALLGMSGIVAKATPMKIIHGGQVIEGTFMEKAKGEDVTKITKNSMMMQTDKDSFNHPEGLKALANLQVLDYICGNIDRHMANMLYQFGKDRNGKVVLTGVCGIDNDTSFGTKLFTVEEKSGKEITPLSEIRNITTSCYEAIKNISLDTLKVVLADKLSAEELDAVCRRTALLKGKVAEMEDDIEKGLKTELNVVQDHEWGPRGYTYDRLTNKPIGITKWITKVVDYVGMKKKDLSTLPEKSDEITYTAGKDVTDQVEFKFQEIYNKLEGFVTRADGLRRKTHVNSAEYNNMLRSLKTALDTGKEIKDHLGDNNKLDIESFNAFAKTVVDLGISSQEYMSAKNLSQFTDLGKDRMALATDMRNLAQENFEVKEMPAKEGTEVKQIL